MRLLRIPDQERRVVSGEEKIELFFGFGTGNRVFGTRSAAAIAFRLAHGPGNGLLTQGIVGIFVHRF